MSNVGEFKIDDVVELININHPMGGVYGKDSSNIVGNIGVITRIHPDDFILCPILVHWDNGSTNGYCADNLRLVQEPNQVYKDE